MKQSQIVIERPVFFKWDGNTLDASENINFIITGGNPASFRKKVDDVQEFCIGMMSNDYGVYPVYAILNGGLLPPSLSILCNGKAYTNKLTELYNWKITEPGLYATLGTLGFARISCVPGGPSQSKIFGASNEITRKFDKSLQGHCYDVHADVFQIIGSMMFKYDEEDGILKKCARDMYIGSCLPFRESDALGDEGQGPILAQLKILDGNPVVRTYWRKAGVCLGVISIPGDGIYTTVTPEVVIRLYPSPTILFSDLGLIQRYNTVFNAHWYPKDKRNLPNELVPGGGSVNDNCAST